MPQFRRLLFEGLIIVLCLSIWRLDLRMETVRNRKWMLPAPKTVLTPRVENATSGSVHADGVMPAIPSRFQLQSFEHSSPLNESSHNDQSSMAVSSWTHVKDYCIELIQGTKNSSLVEWAAYHQPTIKEASRYINAVLKSCDDFLRLGDYVHKPVNFDEGGFPIAYAILVYQDPAQVERLLHAIYRPQNYYCIHVDSKTPEATLNILQRIVNCFPNVFIPKIRHDVKWGDISVVQAQLTCMRELLKEKQWRYFINLTGQEFPLKTNWEIVQILREFKGGNDIKGSFKMQKVFAARRTDYVFIDRVKTSFRKEPPPDGMKLTKGALYVLASRGYVEYVINSKVAKRFLAWVKDTDIPDETFFTTLNYNPQLGVPGSYTGDPDEVNLPQQSVSRFVRWLTKDELACPGKYQTTVHYICLVGVELLPNVTRSMALFANKLDIRDQPVALECLHDWIWDRVVKEYQNPDASYIDVSYYRNLDFVQKHVIANEYI